MVEISNKWGKDPRELYGCSDEWDVCFAGKVIELDGDGWSAVESPEVSCKKKINKN